MMTVNLLDLMVCLVIVGVGFFVLGLWFMSMYRDWLIFKPEVDAIVGDRFVAAANKRRREKRSIPAYLRLVSLQSTPSTEKRVDGPKDSA